MSTKAELIQTLFILPLSEHRLKAAGIAAGAV